MTMTVATDAGSRGEGGPPAPPGHAWTAWAAHPGGRPHNIGPIDAALDRRYGRDAPRWPVGVGRCQLAGAAHADGTVSRARSEWFGMLFTSKVEA